MKIAVIGAGVSGLSVARMLSDSHSVDVYEASDSFGGIARTERVSDATYHKIGGHCFNSKHQYVLDYVFSIYPKEKWNSIERRSQIHFKNHYVSYPIEFSIKEIFEIDSELAYSIVEDMFTEFDGSPSNLAEWFISMFGETLAREYFIPYNKKIWGRDPYEMSYEWVHDKLPTPNKRELIKSLIKDVKDDMPHAYFYYPKTNDQYDFIRALAEGVDVKLNAPVFAIRKNSAGWLINESAQYDQVISTIPMDILPSLIKGAPSEVLSAASNLSYNKVTTMLWHAEPTDNTWTYYPSPDTIFHRHIHVGNFFRPVKNFIITEAIGSVDEEVMIEEGLRYKHLLKPLAYNVSEHAYVVYDENYASSKKVISEYLSEIGMYTLGRFGEWEYYNMDMCIKSALDLVNENF